MIQYTSIIKLFLEEKDLKFSNIRLLFLLMASVLILTACGKKSDAEILASTTWGEAYYQVMKSESPKNNTMNVELQKKLSEIREATGAKYVYTVMPIKDRRASLEGDVNGEFMLTVDGSAEPEDWGVKYESETQFIEAWNGQVAAARSAWNEEENGETKQNWSAFAPIYNKNKEVVALLGIDYPATEVITQYPEWNRDAENWNGYTDELGSPMPAEVEELTTKIKAIAEEHANKLSN